MPRFLLDVVIRNGLISAWSFSSSRSFEKTSFEEVAMKKENIYLFFSLLKKARPSWPMIVHINTLFINL